MEISDRAKLRENNMRHIYLLDDFKVTTHSRKERKLDGGNTRSTHEGETMTGPKKARIAHMHRRDNSALNMIIAIRESVARV